MRVVVAAVQRRLTLLLALALVVSACAGVAGDGTVPAVTATPAPVETTGTSSAAEPGVPSALRDGYDHPAFPEPLIEPSDVISGGPPPDGIPPIDDPKFVDVGTADVWIEDNEPVVYLDIDGDVRAYPVQILIWHEIVNDTVGGVAVSVTYCPLCNSAVTYERVIDGEVTTFGTSGRLYNSALVMYDRATESLWTHYDGRAVIGALVGTELTPIPSPLIGWSDFKANFPDAQVLDREQTGFSRAYGRNPYQGYDDEERTPFLFRGDADERAALMRRVVGVTIGDESAAWALDGVAAGTANAVAGRIGSTDLVIFWKAGQHSALEAANVDGGRDVGSVGVFSSTVDGRILTFETHDGGFVDVETGTEWSIAGLATAGDLAGSQLEAIPHLDTFWFAWSSYRPSTELIDG